MKPITIIATIAAALGLVALTKKSAAASSSLPSYEYVTLGDGAMSVSVLVGGAVYVQLPSGGVLVNASSVGAGVVQPAAPPKTPAGSAPIVAAFNAISPGIGQVNFYWNDANGAQHQGGLAISVGVVPSA